MSCSTGPRLPAAPQRPAHHPILRSPTAVPRCRRWPPWTLRCPNSRCISPRSSLVSTNWTAGGPGRPAARRTPSRQPPRTARSPVPVPDPGQPLQPRGTQARCARSSGREGPDGSASTRSSCIPGFWPRSACRQTCRDRTDPVVIETAAAALPDHRGADRRISVATQDVALLVPESMPAAEVEAAWPNGQAEYRGLLEESASSTSTRPAGRPRDASRWPIRCAFRAPDRTLTVRPQQHNARRRGEPPAAGCWLPRSVLRPS